MRVYEAAHAALSAHSPRSSIRSINPPQIDFQFQIPNLKPSKHLKPPHTTTSNMSQNESGQGVSHAKGSSSVPESVQKQAPSSLEHQLPDSVHDTGSNKETGKVSHATGQSMVPQALQEALPESVEKAVPNAIHDTGNQ